MKTKIFLGVILIGLVAVSALFTSCKGKQSASGKGSHELVIPCAEFGRGDDNYFRADASAESMNLQASREKAMLNAKNRLAGLIGSKIKAVNDRYMNETTVGKNQDYEEKFEGLTREVINQQLVGVKVTCEKPVQTADGKYQTFIALELKKEDLLKGLQDKITNNQKLKVDYDKMKYEKIFNDEMKKLEDEQNK
ncbi:MAG: hypothetical protein HY958_04545 [Bacteroidia bacterium]|nr:hypothetical protein [Bacteroidia bacterium]